MQNPETNKWGEFDPLRLVEKDPTPELGSGAFLSKAAATVDSVALKGQQNAEAVAKSLGGEWDEEITRDLHDSLRKLEDAHRTLSNRLVAEGPLLEGYEEGDERAGEVREALSTLKAAEYLLKPDGPDFVDSQVAVLREQGYGTEQIVEAYLIAGQGQWLLSSWFGMGLPKQEFFDEFASVPGGLELFQNHTSAGECVSTSVFAKVLAGPDGVSRGFRYLKFFQDPDACLAQNREAIDKEEHPDHRAVLTALETFPHVFDDTILSVLRRGTTADADKNAVRASAEAIAIGMMGRDEMVQAFELLKAVGVWDDVRGSQDFAMRLFSDVGLLPEQVVDLADDFPMIREAVRSNVMYLSDAEGSVLAAVSGNWVSDATSRVVEVYGLTWDGLSKKDTVRRWMEYPSNGAEPRRELMGLLELMKPPREQIMKAVNKALISAIDSPHGYVDIGAYDAIQITFGLSEAERASVRLEEVGYRHVMSKLTAGENPVGAARRVRESSQDGDAFMERFHDAKTQDLMWRSFKAELDYNQFATARQLEYFGLDVDKMKDLARERYLGLLEEGKTKSDTDILVEQFGIDLDVIPRSKIDVAIRQGIWESLSSSYLSPVAEFVISHDVSAASANIGEDERSKADLLMKENISSYLKLSEPHRAKLKELFGVSVESLRFPDAAPYLEKQAVAMIRDSKDELAALREAVPRIVEQEWYRGAARRQVYEFVRDGKGRNVDVRSFVASIQKLTGLPNWLFRSPEIISMVNEKVSDSMMSEDYQAVIPYAEAFGVSVSDDMAAMFMHGGTKGLYQFGTLIARTSVNEWKQGGVQAKLEQTMHSSPKLGDELTQFYTSRRNFDGLAMAIDLGIASVPYPDESDALRELQKLVTKGDAIAAEGLLNCYGPLGSKLFDAGLRERIKRAAMAERGRRANRETVALDKAPHKVERELADFYLDEWIGFELSSLERKAQSKNAEFDFSSKMDAYNLKEVMRENTDSQFTWMREYLARSVIGEMRHQTEFNQPKKSFVPLPGDVDAWIAQATNEEIRQRMAAAKERFVEPGWSSSYGGEPWAQIAATAEMMFGNEPDKHKLVDLAYDLSHNNGTVFNKEMLRIHQMATAKITHVLSAKREVSDPEAYLALLEREVESTTFAEARRRWDQWKDVRAKMERNIDGAETDRRAGYVEAIRER